MLQAVEEAAPKLKGFDQLGVIPGSTYRDNSTHIVIPTRGLIDSRVVSSWQSLIAPMNQKRSVLFARGDEVGKAYDAMISNLLANPDLASWKYVLTLEDDNIVPPDAHIRLLESIEWGHFDVIGGLYFTKGAINMPMAYGDPDEYLRTGVLDFRPRSVAEAVAAGQVMQVNGTGMGCTLYRLELFKELPPPWFITVADVIDGQPQAFTQDLSFSRRLKLAGKRLAVDCRVKVGHLDVNTGELY
jgi:hypothetical protein